jgi:hypothetical protein
MLFRQRQEASAQFTAEATVTTQTVGTNLHLGSESRHVQKPESTYLTARMVSKVGPVDLELRVIVHVH